MKLKHQICVTLWLTTLFIPFSVRADDAAMQGVMGIMQMMQQQSRTGADPDSAAMMDAIGNAVDGANRDRQDRRDRSGQNGRGERQRGQGSGNSHRSERQRGSASASAGSDRRRSQD